METTDGMFDAMCQHLKHATNGGVLKSTITVFRHRQPGKEDMRVWNFFGLSYAGYESKDQDDLMGEPVKIGDQGNLDFTRVC